MKKMRPYVASISLLLYITWTACMYEYEYEKLKNVNRSYDVMKLYQLHTVYGTY